MKLNVFDVVSLKNGYKATILGVNKNTYKAEILNENGVKQETKYITEDDIKDIIVSK